MKKTLMIGLLCIMGLITTGFSGISETSTTEYGQALFLSYGSTCVLSAPMDGSTLGVSNGSVYPGANVGLQQPDDSSIQKWVLQSAGDGYYYIRNLHSWKVLEQTNGPLRQQEADGTAGQRWRFFQTESGNTLVINEEGQFLSTRMKDPDVLDPVGSLLPDPGQLWKLQMAESKTALDFQKDGIQTVGIRSFRIRQGNVEELSPYYPIRTDIWLPDGGYSLSGGKNYSIGIKTLYVNRFLSRAGYLNRNYLHSGRFDRNTTNAVIRFQSGHGLKADGVVEELTWEAMGFSAYEYRHLGDYRTPLKTSAYGSSRAVSIYAMLDTAREYAEAGTTYLSGASGKPGTYIDCSGLVFQCLYSVGINPQVNIIDHARNDYDFCSRYLGGDPKLGKTVSQARAGDLVFYGNGTINHVGICAGKGMVYDATPEYGVAYRSIDAPGKILKIVRIF